MERVQSCISRSTSHILRFPFFLPYATIVYDMEIVRTILPYAQIILSILLVAAILLQQRGSSIGGALGGDNFSATYHKRRGAELFLFRLSVVLAILFVASTFLSLVI
jgi:protein translocase SecG subunit